MDNYIFYNRLCTELINNHNLEALKLPKNWRSNLYIDKKRILTENAFYEKLNTNIEFSTQWRFSRYQYEQYLLRRNKGSGEIILDVEISHNIRELPELIHISHDEFKLLEKYEK